MRTGQPPRISATDLVVYPAARVVAKEYKPIRCRACKGAGQTADGEVCRRCVGTGYLSEEAVAIFHKKRIVESEKAIERSRQLIRGSKALKASWRKRQAA